MFSCEAWIDVFSMAIVAGLMCSPGEAWIDVFSMAAWIDVFSMAIVAGLMCSPVRTGLIKFSCRGILPMQSGTHGKYLSSDQ